MSFISKVELKYQLEKMGIKVVEGNYIRKTDIPSIFAAKNANPFFGKAEGFSYAINIEGIDNEFPTKPFGRQLDEQKKLKEFLEKAKKAYVGAKGKPTLKAVKDYIKANNLKQFYAKWESDSDMYKDDSVELFYI